MLPARQTQFSEAPGKPRFVSLSTPSEAVPAYVALTVTRTPPDGAAEAIDAFTFKALEPLSSPTIVTALLPEESTKLSVTAVCAPTTVAGATGKTDSTNPAADNSTPKRRIIQFSNIAQAG